MVMLLMPRGVVPLFVSVTACAELLDPTFWLPKLTSVGFRLTRGAAVAPVPLSATDCGLSVALSVKVKVALRAPRAPAVKVTLIVHELPAANVLVPLGQVLVCAKSEAFVPLMAMLLMLKAEEPLLDKVTACAVLVAPTM